MKKQVGSYSPLVLIVRAETCEYLADLSPLDGKVSDLSVAFDRLLRCLN